MFTDTKFMTARDKELTFKAWRTFLKYGCQRKHFTKRLYYHLIQHCSFIAHYNKHGFYSDYFTDPNKAKDFIGQFDTGQSIECGGDRWLTGDYEDINRAMCEAVGPYKADIYTDCSSAEFKRDTAIITGLVAKYKINNVLAVEGGYQEGVAFNEKSAHAETHADGCGRNHPAGLDPAQDTQRR